LHVLALATAAVVIVIGALQQTISTRPSGTQRCVVLQQLKPLAGFGSQGLGMSYPGN
jgi:hypothetical protein